MPVAEPAVQSFTRIRIVPPANANEEYSEPEIELILSQLPTHANAVKLAVVLKRSVKAIMLIYSIAYSGKMLKQSLVGNGPDNNNVIVRIARVKRKLGIFIGHKPKATVIPNGRGGFIVDLPDNE